MQTKRVKTPKRRNAYAQRALLFVAVLLLVGGSFSAWNYVAQAAACHSTTDCRDKISDLQSANNDAQRSLNSLLAEASSYQDAISKLQAQIDSLRETIAANEAKQASIQAEIVQKQAEIDHQREILASILKSMYLDDQMSTIEMLATSKNLSDYVDKEEYRATVQTKIQTTMAEITQLQAELKQQKNDVESLLASQRTQESMVAANRAKQASLLAMNQSQQSSFNSQLASNKAQIRSLQIAQAALNARGSSAVYVAASGGSGGACDNGGGNGGYPMPWCNAAKDSVVTSFHPSPGNYTNRECTSFAYWYFTSVLGHTDFRVGYGDALTWTWNSNYPTHDTPAVNSIGVKTTGTYGHVVIVKALPGQTFGGVSVPPGRVLVYEMNSDFSGHFRAALRDIDSFGGFLY